MKRIEIIWIITLILITGILLVFLLVSGNARSQYEYGVNTTCDDAENSITLLNNKTSYNIRIENDGDGNSWEKVEISSEGTPDYWNSSLSEIVLILNQGESKNVTLNLTAPSNASVGDEAKIEVIAKVVDGSNGPPKISEEDSIITNTIVIKEETQIDKQKPIVIFTTPIEGETIDKSKTTIMINGTASDDVKITKVQIRINDGVWQDTIGTINWTYEWDLKNIDTGNHTIYVRAFDGNNNSEIENITVKIVEKEVESKSEEESKIILIISIFGIIAAICIIGFVMYKKKSSGSHILPINQQTQFQTQQIQQQTPQIQQQSQPIQQSQTNFQQTQTCPFCNAQVPIQFKFCNMCGKQIKN